MAKTKLLKTARAIDLTKGEDLVEELRKLYLDEKLYYINVFEGMIPVMQFKMSRKKILKRTIYCGAVEISKMAKDMEEAANCGTYLLEVDVKGYLQSAFLV
ncbi:hypothetical protein ABFY54_29375 [Priestia megaterium]|uniref:hypothetical protein n=1 Tax=Priestia megaterium TaxID=1404 RepID=UPI003D2CC90F